MQNNRGIRREYERNVQEIRKLDKAAKKSSYSITIRDRIEIIVRIQGAHTNRISHENEDRHNSSVVSVDPGSHMPGTSLHVPCHAVEH